MPAAFLANVPQGVAIAYALIPQVPALPEPLKQQVQDAFAKSLQVLWEVLIGIGGAGLLVSLLMKGLPLHTHLDDEWAPETPSPSEDLEKKETMPTVVVDTQPRDA